MKWVERLAAFFDRHPLFGAAMAAVACILLANFHPVVGWVGIGLIGGIGAVLGKSRLAIAWVICGLVAVTVFSLRNHQRDEIGSKLLKSGGGPVEAVLSADSKGGGGLWSAPVELLGKHRGAKVWWEGRGVGPVSGARVSASGNFQPLPEPRNPGEFDEAEWLRRKGISAVFQASEGRVETPGWPAFGARLRAGFRTAVTIGLEEDSESARVIRAIVMGEIPPDSDELIAAFRNSGTLHIFSVSGMHVAMLGSIAWLVLRFLGVPRKWAIIGLIPLIFGYAWICGNSPPALRSAWMMAVFLLAFVFQRRPDLLNALGAVLLGAMLWNGNLLFQAGVQLSYGVVAAIAVGTAWATRAFVWLEKPEEYLPQDLRSGWQSFWQNLRHQTAQSLAVSSAAWAGSTPLTVFHFGLVTPVAVISSVILVPIVFGLLSAALVSAAVYPVWPEGAKFVNRANGKWANGCVWTAKRFSEIPGSHFQVRRDSEPFLLIYDLEYGAGAACFSGGNAGGVMIDCGDPRGFKRKILPSLRKRGVEPDSVVLSHADGNHLGGASQVWEGFPVKQALLPVGKSRSPNYRSWLEDAPEAGVKVLQASGFQGVPLPLGAWLEVLHAPETDSQNASADERVAIFRLHWNGWKILFTSDAGLLTERKLLDSGKNLDADVIVAGRHTRDLALGDEFLDAVKPQVIVASHADFPIEERLSSRQVEYWKSRGIQVMNQKQTGGVTIRVVGETLRLEGFVDGTVVELGR
jgi:competence protein ComEC